MRAAAVLLVVLIATTASGAGFTKAELDALPKPDPIEPGPAFFSGPNRPKQASHADRTPQQRYLLAARARYRRARGRELDSQSTVNMNVIYAERAAASFASGAGWHLP